VGKAKRAHHPTPERTSSEGVARRKAQTYGIAISPETARAPLGAPHALKQRERDSANKRLCAKQRR